MKIKQPKDKTATLYYFELKRLGGLLKKEEKKREQAEKEVEELRNKLKEAEEKIKGLEEENDNLKECRKTYAKMLFKGKTKKTSHVKRGREKGHLGVSRKQPEANLVNKEIDVKVSRCPECNKKLGGCRRKYSRIVENIIIQPQREVIKYWIHQYECKHCGEKISGKPKEGVGQSPFGKNVFGAALFYRYRMKTPIEKIAECFREMHGLKISTGAIQNLFYQASVQFGEKYEELKQLLIDGNKIHGDETGWRVNGENWWTWLWTNDDISLYTTEKTRGRGIPEKLLKTFKGLLIRDGYNSYNGVDTEQQICWIHLLRKAHEYCSRERSSSEMIILKDVLKTCYRRMNRWHRKKHTEEERNRYEKRMKYLLQNIWKTREWKEKDSQTFIKEWLIRHQDRLTKFLKYEYGCPENNPAERAIRPMVIFRKISGGSKSKRGIKATDINMSIFQTWAKQNLSIIQNLPVFGLSL